MAVIFMQITEGRKNKTSLSPIPVENELVYPNYSSREDGDSAAGSRPSWVTQADHDGEPLLGPLYFGSRG